MQHPEPSDSSCGVAALAPDWAFVVQLRQGTSFASAELCGRIEHVVSGRSSRFDSLEQARAFMEHVIAGAAGKAP